MIRRLAFAFLALAPSAVAASEWKGEAAAGLLTTSGNSETQSINGKFNLEYLTTKWKNRFTATALNNSDEEESTAERYTVGDQLDYNFNPKNYAFVAVDWEKDRFGGFRERTVQSLGYGHRFLTGPKHLLDAEIGAGARQTEAQDTGEREDEFIGRLSSRYQWVISETSTFSQSIKVESGSENTFSEAVSELKLSIIGNVFAGISFTARNNSDVPPDTKKTDTYTAVNLSYTFGSK
ncbi:DUF481 domain-containing protein [Panacagrimonas sp.]|uniref:DUF481 domain-containing protein n=1 Tax=Panacagrimonas sp. TaxID=2480088 RepID=UPI003B52C617